MAYRVIMIENEVSIKVKLNNLIISKGLEKRCGFHWKIFR